MSDNIVATVNATLENELELNTTLSNDQSVSADFGVVYGEEKTTAIKVSSVLLTGSTTITIISEYLTEDKTVFVVTDPNIYYEEIDTSTEGQVTLVFPVQEMDINIQLIIL